MSLIQKRALWNNVSHRRCLSESQFADAENCRRLDQQKNKFDFGEGFAILESPRDPSFENASAGLRNGNASSIDTDFNYALSQRHTSAILEAKPAAGKRKSRKPAVS